MICMEILFDIFRTSKKSNVHFFIRTIFSKYNKCDINLNMIYHFIYLRYRWGYPGAGYPPSASGYSTSGSGYPVSGSGYPSGGMGYPSSGVSGYPPSYPTGGYSAGSVSSNSYASSPCEMTNQVRKNITSIAIFNILKQRTRE